MDTKGSGIQYFIRVNMKSNLTLSIFLMHVPGLIGNDLSVYVIPKKTKMSVLIIFHKLSL